MKTDKVYFICAPGRVKVGFTRRPEKRLTALQRADMEELIVIAVIDGKRDLEKKIHQQLQPYRLRGEWFEDCPEVRQVIADAIAGKIAIEEPRLTTSPKAPDPVSIGPDPAPFSPEYQIVARLLDKAEASATRGDSKHEVRGRAESALLAVEAYLKLRAEGVSA